MKPGRAVYIRVNPRDCMSVADVLRQIDIVPRGMSFAQGVSIALSSCLEGLRQTGIIPKRDGFEFSDLMAQFPPDRKADRARKLDISRAIQDQGDFSVPSIIPESTERRRKRARYEELKFKQQHDKLNWTDDLQQEFMPLVDEFFQP